VDADPISDALVRRLRATSGATGEELQAIRALPFAERSYVAGKVVVRDGDRSTECCLVVEGFCLRSKTTSTGLRQILSIHIPGEIPDLQSLHLHEMDHDLVALTDCTLGFIGHTTLRKFNRRWPNVAEIFWRDTLIDAALFREWIVNVGQRPAPSRLAHIIVELRERLRVIGRANADGFEMPLTQEQIGEAMGITAVHANRVIRQLREDNVVEFHRGRVTVLNDTKLTELADFDGRYLHQSPDL
jgi:CRP-like cAMP-binding protein